MECIVCGHLGDMEFCSNECFADYQDNLAHREAVEVDALERMWSL